MNSFATAKQLNNWIMQQCNGYKPLTQAIHILLYKHNIKPHIKYFNNKPTKCYDTKNAQRVIMQHLQELITINNKTQHIMTKQIKITEHQLHNIIKNAVNNLIKESIDNNLYDEWYQEEDYNGNQGKPGLIKSYDIGTYYIQQAEQDAHENDFDNVKDYLKFFFDETKFDTPWYWTKVNPNYKTQGNIIFQENNTTCIEFCDQIFLYEDIDNSDFYNRLQSGEYWTK